ncbi:MAG: HAD hydrolase-like protein [Bacteroidota bacterium]
MAHYSQIYFDLDGTLCDSYPGIEKGFLNALEQMGVGAVTEAELKKLIGTPLTTSLYTFFPNDDEKVAEGVALFREYYRDKGLFESVLYPGVADMIPLLATTSRLYLATNKPTLYARQMLEHHGLLSHFTDVRGVALEGPNTFTKSGAILDSWEGGKAIMVGDKPQDINEGKKAGIDSMGVLYGYGTEEEVHGATPTHVVVDIAEMTKILIAE